MKVLRPILMILLSALVLVSSSNFFVGLHSCMGNVNDVAFLEKADGCEHSKLPPCHRQLMKDCCDDSSITHESEGFKADFQKIAFSSPLICDVIHTSQLIAEIIPESSLSRIKYLKYDIPLPSSDRTVLHQVFLI